jgi:hypothetical protein
MVSKVKVDAIESTTGSGTIALNNQFSGMTVASLPTSGTLPALDGSVLTNMPAGGKVLQVVQGALVDSIYTTSTTFADLLTKTITPTNSSTKILVTASIQTNCYGGNSTNNVSVYCYLKSNLGGLSYGKHSMFGNESGDNTDQENGTVTMSHLHDHNQSSALTYTIQIRAAGGSGARAGAISYTSGSNGDTRIILMEIKG